jgi:signal transduction histidine kinase
VTGPAGAEERLALLVHELRSPVAALSAISDALADEREDGDSLRELVRLALVACRSAARIVADAALGPLELGEVDVEEVVHDAVAAAVLEGGEVRATIDGGLPRVSADEVRLRQALDNLVRNALMHSGSSGEVVVSARRDGDSICISVADRGRGISPDDQARIFEPGARLDPSAEGAGLGLAVSRAIARAHGGTLTVESTPGAGAVFTIVLPSAGWNGAELEAP